VRNRCSRRLTEHRSILVEGLKRLEYRGYDSCGVAVWQDGGLKRSRSTERVAELDALVRREGVIGTTGIAHTRWATHGAPAVHNAHPHFSHGTGKDATASRPGRIAVVHNGIVENHEGLARSSRRAATRSRARPTPR
jgi:glucosamine--fructose-6-phosphate aminotransferase (isomerizing)